LSIKNISIIGLGLIGGSIAKALKYINSPIIIKGFDHPLVLDEAMNDGIIDGSLKTVEDARDSDIIFLCLPTEISLEYFSKLIPLLNDGTIISDVSGVKTVFEEEWKKFKSKGSYIGGHPMTGKETNGYNSSDPLLFENSVYIISGYAKKEKRLNEFLDVISSLGARIRFLDPYLHDKVIAKVSHLPQLLAVALVNSIQENGKNPGDINYLDFAAGGFRDMTRIASSNFDIWEPVLKMNRDEIISAISSLNKNLSRIEELLRGGDLKSLEELFQKARTKRDEIPRNTKGFINPLFDVFIFVADKPGVLSKLSTVMFENNINIKDVEILKIREGTGGTMRFSFDNKATAKKARLLIEQAGFITQ
jgi:prephenate dehydrogenase